MLDCACALTEVQSSAASSCQATSQPQRPEKGSAAVGPLGGWINHPSPAKQEPFAGTAHGEKLPKSNTALVLLRLLGWQKELWREAAHLACEDLFLSSRWNQRQCWSVVTSSLILQHPHNPSLSLTSPQSRNLPRFAV